MATPTQPEGDLHSTANSSESLVDLLHYSLSQSLPLEQRYKLDQDWKRQEAEHSYSEAKKTMSYTWDYRYIIRQSENRLQI